MLMGAPHAEVGLSETRQLALIDADPEWSAAAPPATAPKRRRVRQPRPKPEAQGETVAISRAEYEELLYAKRYLDQDRARTRRSKARREALKAVRATRPVLVSRADRSESEARPVSINRDRSSSDPTPVPASSCTGAAARTRPVPLAQVREHSDRSARREGGLRGRTPELRRTGVPPLRPSIASTTGPHNPSDQVAQLLTQAGIPFTLTRADRRAVKGCTAPPAVIAAAFAAVVRGEWNHPWLRQNLSVQQVVKHLSAFQNPSSSGAAAPGVAVSAFSHDPWEGRTPPIAEADLDAFYADRGAGA